jgi:hypothetical protein
MTVPSGTSRQSNFVSGPFYPGMSSDTTIRLTGHQELPRLIFDIDEPLGEAPDKLFGSLDGKR